MAEVGHPERGLRGALVGGTNGKGSVVAMTVSILGAAGLRVGTHAEAAPRQLPRADRRRRRAARARTPSRRPSSGCCRPSTASRPTVGPPTEFEALTAAAIAELARQDVDLAIVEVGHGRPAGRDQRRSTSAWRRSPTSSSTTRRYLGPTLAAIGGEKAPIIKRRQPGGDRRRRPRPAADPRPVRRAGRAAAAAPGRASRIGPRCATAAGTGSWSTPGPRRGGWTACAIGLLGRAPGRRTRRWRSRCSTRWPSGGASSVDESALRAGHGGGTLARAARGARRVRASASDGSCSTGRTTRRARAALADALDDLGVRRPTIVFGAMRDEEGARRAARPRAARPALRLHVGRRSRRARPGDAGAGLAIASPGRPRRTAPDPAERALADGRRRPGGRRRLALPRRRGPRHADRNRRGGVMEPRAGWGERTYVMGILNVTPDSFSGDGLATPDRGIDEIVAARRRAGRRLRRGRRRDPRRRVPSRPGRAARTAITRRSTRRRRPRLAIPVVRAVADGGRRPRHRSASTRRKGTVARAALAAGARIVNDVWAAHRDPDTAVAAAEAGRAPRPDAQPGGAGLPGRRLRDRRRLAAIGGRGGRRARGRARADHRRPGHRLRQGDRGEPRAAASAGGAEGRARRAAAARRHESQAVPRRAARRRPARTIESRAPPRPSPWPSRPARTSSGSTTSRTSPARGASPMPSCADDATIPDRLSLRGMRFVARHGVLPQEKVEPQRFEVDVVLHADLARAAETDELDDTIDYSALHELVRRDRHRSVLRPHRGARRRDRAGRAGRHRSGTRRRGRGPRSQAGCADRRRAATRSRRRCSGAASIEPGRDQRSAGSSPSVTSTSLVELSRRTLRVIVSPGECVTISIERSTPAADLLAIDRGDDVALLQAGGLGGAPGEHGRLAALGADQRAVVDRQALRLGQRRADRDVVDADPRAGELLARRPPAP